jgi:hypothetical protein
VDRRTICNRAKKLFPDWKASCFNTFDFCVLQNSKLYYYYVGTFKRYSNAHMFILVDKLQQAQLLEVVLCEIIVYRDSYTLYEYFKDKYYITKCDENLKPRLDWREIKKR